MKPFLRSALAIVFGTISFSLLVTLFEVFAHRICPPPPKLDLSKPGDLQGTAASMTAGTFALRVLGWFASTLAGACVATQLASQSQKPFGLPVDGIALAGAVANMLMIAYTLRVRVLGFAEPLSAASPEARLANGNSITASRT
jgi:hypothetical protein